MKKLIIILLIMIGMSACGNAQDRSYTDMNVENFSNYIGKNGVQLVDVRTPEEYAEGHIAGALNIDIFDDDFISKALKNLDKSKPVAVYCRSGRRSADAAEKLSENGYDVTNLLGGILAWEEDKKPVETDSTLSDKHESK
ncbi:MAG: rhodanese-like domain-containing protein [Muribaculaceae bacterium]|nr:rhodanese-like domain-containing protein [Muribaculaceae bacterium]